MKHFYSILVILIYKFINMRNLYSVILTPNKNLRSILNILKYVLHHLWSERLLYNYVQKHKL